MYNYCKIHTYITCIWMISKNGGVEKEFIDSLIRNGGWLSVCRVTSFLQISWSLKAAKCWDQRVPSLCLGMNITSPRHPVLFSDNAWGVQSPSLRFNYSQEVIWSLGLWVVEPPISQIGSWKPWYSWMRIHWIHKHFVTTMFFYSCGESLKKPSFSTGWKKVDPMDTLQQSK